MFGNNLKKANVDVFWDKALLLSQSPNSRQEYFYYLFSSSPLLVRFTFHKNVLFNKLFFQWVHFLSFEKEKKTVFGLYWLLKSRAVRVSIMPAHFHGGINCQMKDEFNKPDLDFWKFLEVWTKEFNLDLLHINS